MNSNKFLQITVPGSTANIGPGFDSLGIAVNRYLTLQVEPGNRWEFIPKSSSLDGIATGTDNLIYKVASNLAKKFGRNLPECRITLHSEIPLARGLGSSAAAIVAAIELVNELCDFQFTKKEKLNLACQFEGHPDNVGASLFGGFVIGCYRGEQTDIIHDGGLHFDMIAIIPPYEIKTKDARKVLPHQFSYEDSVKASAISNVLVAALLTNNIEMIGRMMELDLFHQPYRVSLIPEFHDIQSTAKKFGAFGVAISGAGPTIMCFAEEGTSQSIRHALIEEFPNFGVEAVSIARQGSMVTSNAKGLENIISIK